MPTNGQSRDTVRSMFAATYVSSRLAKESIVGDLNEETARQRAFSPRGCVLNTQMRVM